MAATTFISISELSSMIGTCRQSTERYLTSGRGPRAIKLPSGRWRISRKDAEKWIDSMVSRGLDTVLGVSNGK